MIISNVVTYKNLPAEEYFRLPGVSYSSIKWEGAPPMEENEGMKLGTLVHTYLLEPAKYTHERSELVKPLAATLKNAVGPLFKTLVPEMAVTADFEYQGLVMPFKGRLDLCIPGRIVIDFKVLGSGSLAKTVEYFGYGNQQNGYAAAIGAKQAVIISINLKTKRSEFYSVPITHRWWEYQIAQRGKAKY